MKTINNYINEKLTLNSQSTLIKYNFCPENFDELRGLIEQLLKERGKDANLNDIDVSQITSFYNEEKNIGLFNHLDPHNIDISKWHVNNVENMYAAFYGCKNFNCNLINWDVRKVESMAHMFERCSKFTGNGLEKWKPIRVTDTRSMFANCEMFNCNLSNWDVRNIYYMYEMFKNCINFTGNGLNNWKVSVYTKMYHMFDNCPKLKNNPDWYKD